MARRGVFGRLPRAAPDLTNTLVALIREANAQEDSNYVDAWKNGGKVEGHGVDDEKLLEHFRKRRDALSPDDPLWDEWNNRVAQYDFSINESKMSLKFDQKKVTEAQVSAFYGKWLKRPEIQQDSEFYRHLLSQQAKWHNAAVQGNAARGASNAYENHQKWVAGVMKRETDPAEMAHGYIMQIAKVFDAVPDQQNATLEDVYETSTGWGRVLDITDNGKSDDPGIQKMMDEATKEIRKTPGNEDFVFDKAHIADLDAKADHGYGLLKKNAMNKSEKETWNGRDAAHKYGAARIKQAEASTRLGIAADKWTTDLDACNGNPYCAKNATKVYRDSVARESKHLLAGQGETTLATQDTGQAKMILNTLRTLDTALAGKTVEATGAAAMSGIAGAGIEETQADVIARGGKAGDRTPENIIGGWSNIFNDQIKKLDKGGWVSVDPQADPFDSTRQATDGNQNPVFKYTVHDATETPAPGLYEVPAITSFTDFNTTGPASGPSGVPGPKTVLPRQFVRAEPPPLVALTEGGDPVDTKGLVPTDAKGTQLAAAPNYMVLRTIGPDGNTQTLYRTGGGTKADPFLIHTAPPVKPESAGGPKMVKVNGVMVPQYTAKPGKNGKNEDILTYDATPVADGITDARNNNNPAKRYPLGTYQNISSASAAVAVNDIFNKGGANANADAAKMYKSFSDNLTSLPPQEQAKYAGDLYQLGKTVELRTRGVTGKPLDDNYDDLNKISPQQQIYRDQLGAKGFNTQNGIPEAEIGRRVTLLTQLDQAETRLGAASGNAGSASNWMGDLGYHADPAWRMRATLNGADQTAIGKAKEDIFNPTISVSNIKIPGFTPMMQGAPNPSFIGDLVNASRFGAPVPGAMPTTAYTAPKPPPTTFKPPTNGPAAGPNAGGSTGNFVPPPAATTALTPPSGPAAGPNAAKPPPTTYTPPLSGMSGIGASGKKDDYTFVNGRKVYY